MTAFTLDQMKPEDQTSVIEKFSAALSTTSSKLTTWSENQSATLDEESVVYLKSIIENIRFILHGRDPSIEYQIPPEDLPELSPEESTKAQFLGLMGMLNGTWQNLLTWLGTYRDNLTPEAIGELQEMVNDIRKALGYTSSYTGKP